MDKGTEMFFKMNVVLKFIIWSLLLILAVNCKADNTEKINLSLQYFQELQHELQSKLQLTMKAGGPVAAISTCNIQGPVLEQALSNDKLIIRRVSLKQRNSAHKADPTESEILNAWQGQIDKGEALALTSEKETANGFYVMKPIMLAKDACLKCHGDKASMSPALLQKISVLYPADQATGYKKGELRGAFVAIWK